MRLVVALGGNALLRRGEPAEAEVQKAHVLGAASALAALAADHAGGEAVIGALGELRAIVRGESGTRIVSAASRAAA
jgi:carbamate kinase